MSSIFDIIKKLLEGLPKEVIERILEECKEMVEREIVESGITCQEIWYDFLTCLALLKERYLVRAD